MAGYNNKGKDTYDDAGQYDPANEYSQDPYAKPGYDMKSDPEYQKYLQTGGSSNYEKWLAGQGAGGAAYGGGYAPSAGYDPNNPGAVEGDVWSRWGAGPYEVNSSYSNTFNPGVYDDTSWGGISGVNPEASQADYDSVRGYADAAYQEAQRYMDPQLAEEDARFTQELINRGIDPYSEQGQKAFMMKERGQSDMQSKAMFDSLGFGQGIQEQMFGQELSRSELANALIKANWDVESGENMFGANLNEQGRQFDVGAAMKANDMNYNQMMGIEGLGFRDWWAANQQQNWQDEFDRGWLDYVPGGGAGGDSGTSEEQIIAEIFGGNMDAYNTWLAQAGGI